MIFRVVKLLMQLPVPKHPDANAAAAVQELMGGKSGELSTLMNYFIQSNNFRGRKLYAPFYDLVANIAAEEWGHVELVQYAINLLLTGSSERGDDPAAEPLAVAVPSRNTHHFFASSQTALPMDSMGHWWNGSYVNTTGNLRLDLLNNFQLELNARATKIRVYETTSDPTVRALTGFLIVRGGTHIIAFAKALEKLTGVEVGRLLPIPDVTTDKFPECRTFIEQGLYNTMYRFSPKDYRQLDEIWNGVHPETGEELVVTDDPMPTLADPPYLEAEPQLASPAGADELEELSERLFGMSTAKLKKKKSAKV